MNLAPQAPLWLLILLAILVAAAAIEDATRLRISNLTCGAVFATAIAAIAIHGPEWSLWQNWVAFAAILALGTAAFAGGLVGGGDVKLLAVLALWFDLKGAALLIGATFVGGGVVAALYIIARTLGHSRQRDWKSGQIPYGLAIAVGALFVFSLQLDQRPAELPRSAAPISATPH